MAEDIIVSRTDMTKLLYRYEGTHWGDEGGPVSSRLYAHTFHVVKETPKGCWIDVYGKRKFILNDAVKRYAYPTKELALQSFIARKRRQCAILRAQLKNAEGLLAYASVLKEPPP